MAGVSPLWGPNLDELVEAKIIKIRPRLKAEQQLINIADVSSFNNFIKTPKKKPPFSKRLILYGYRDLYAKMTAITTIVSQQE